MTVVIALGAMGSRYDLKGRDRRKRECRITVRATGSSAVAFSYGWRVRGRTGLVNAKKRTDIMHALFGVSNVDGCRTSGFDRFPVGYDHKCLAVVGGWQVLEVAIERNNDLESQCIVVLINGDTI